MSGFFNSHYFTPPPETAATLAAKKQAEEAQAEYEAAMNRSLYRRDKIAETKRELDKVGHAIGRLDLDFAAIEHNAKETIRRLFGDPFGKNKVDCAFVDLQRLPILRELLPDALKELEAEKARLQAKLERLEAEDAADPIFGGAT
jgi:hypothetical protein